MYLCFPCLACICRSVQHVLHYGVTPTLLVPWACVRQGLLLWCCSHLKAVAYVAHKRAPQRRGIHPLTSSILDLLLHTTSGCNSHSTARHGTAWGAMGCVVVDAAAALCVTSVQKKTATGTLLLLLPQADRLCCAHLQGRHVGVLVDLQKAGQSTTQHNMVTMAVFNLNFMIE